MKKILFIIITVAFGIALQAQTEGISYQAVILNPDAQQLPGTDLPNTPLVEALVSLRFTIKNEDGSVAYQEILDTQTDVFGMVHVFIGSGTSTNSAFFNEINWNGTYKSLAIELDVNLGRGFVFLSEQPLSYTPQAYHRNIIADGDLTVEGAATFNGDFAIEGQTTIGDALEVDGDLSVNEDLDVSEDLNVGEDIIVGDDLTVNGVTQLNNLTVRNNRPTALTGTLEVDGFTTVNNGISVAMGAAFGQNVSVVGNHNVAGVQFIGSNQDIVGRQVIGGDQIVGGLQRVNGNQRVEGEQRVLLSQQVFQNQLVNGNSTVGGNFILSGSANIDETLSVGSTADITSRLTVGGETNLLGRLNVNSITTIGGSMEVAGFTFIDDNFGVANNISAGSGLDVAGKASILGDFSVNGVAKFNSAVKVDGGATTFLTGPLTVEELGRFSDGISIDNGASSVLTGTLNVGEDAVFDEDVLIDGTLTVNNNLALQGLVVSGNNTASGNHVALFENTAQSAADGIAIKINDTSLSEENQFVTFYGEGNYVAGKIESFSTPNGFAQDSGIVYGSTGADYAEWLEKEDPSQKFKVGEVVGVKAGKISRNTKNADHILTISLAPIVLGNMPEESRKEDFEKVGFMGQVPALVRGKVNKGDYILASGAHDGFAIAVPPKELTLDTLKNVIGKAWTASSGDESLINVSVGLKSNEWVEILEQQENRIEALENKLHSLEILSEKIMRMEAKLNAIDMN